MRVLANEGEGDFSEPRVAQRLLGDFLHPGRPATPTHVVNTVSAEVGADVAGWRFERVLSFYGGLERRASEQGGPEN